MHLEQGENMNLQSSYPVNVGKNGSLEEMFDRMEIKMVGRENEDVKSEKSMEDEEGSDIEDELNETMFREDNKIS